MSTEKRRRMPFFSSPRKTIFITAFLVLLAFAVACLVFLLSSRNNTETDDALSEEMSYSDFSDTLRHHFYQDGYEAAINYAMERISSAQSETDKGEYYLLLAKDISYVYDEERLEDAIRYAKVADNLSESADAACFVSGLAFSNSLDGYDSYAAKCEEAYPSRDLNDPGTNSEGGSG